MKRKKKFSHVLSIIEYLHVYTLARFKFSIVQAESSGEVS